MTCAIEQFAKVHVKVTQKRIEAVHITERNAKVTSVEPGEAVVVEHDAKGQPLETRRLPFRFSMFLPAFKGVDAVAAVPGLCNPRGFVLVDKLTPGELWREIIERKNMAVALLAGAVAIGISNIIAAAVHG